MKEAIKLVAALKKGTKPPVANLQIGRSYLYTLSNDVGESRKGLHRVFTL